MGVMTDPAAAQDALRPLRNFVSLLSGAAGEQTWAEADAYAVNPPGQLYTQGPNGIAIEGKPITVAPASGQKQGIPPWLILAGVVAAGWALTRS